MSAVLRVVRAEGYRLLRTRSSWIVLLALFILSVLRVFASHVAESAETARRIASGRGPETVADSGDAWAPFVDGWRMGLMVAALVLLVHAARSLAGDREAGLLRMAVTRGATRLSLVLGRVLLAVVLVPTLVAVTGVGAWLCARYYFDFGPLVEDGYELLSVEELSGELRVAVLAALPALFGLYCFGLLVSSLCRSAILAVGSSLILFFVFDLFKDPMREAQYWVFASFSPSFFDGSAMKEMAGMARGFSDAGYPPGLLEMNLWLPWPQAAIMITLAAVVLSRRSL